ncbi:MAG: Mut7-C RNAse domain-containing protein [Candidatus Rifleibacteriota bacterium]
MINITIRFFEELNDFLKKDQKKKELQKALKHHTTMKDLIESFNVPHTEVDLINVNGEPADLDQKVQDGDIIMVYPVFESFDISNISRLGKSPLRDLKFIADCHLGKLTRRLRTLGLDVEFADKVPKKELIKRVVDSGRVLLTRDHRLLMHKVIEKGYLIRSQNSEIQTEEVIKRFQLENQLKPFTRCPLCNGILEPVAKNEILHLLEPKTKLYFNQFYQCQHCNQVYWRGSHFSELENFVNKFALDSSDKQPYH